MNLRTETMLKKLLHEPLIHFCFIGIVLFALFGMVGESESDRDNRLVVTQAHVDRLVKTFQKRWSRMPGQAEVKNLVEGFIRQEILYREALAIGLDKDDAVVRRRMAQKIDFMFKDIATPSEPDDAQLQDYLKKHPEKFTRPPRYTFSHVYLNADKRGDKVIDDAKQLLARLQQSANKPDLSTAGDALMLDHHYTDFSQPEVARLFGQQFSEKLNTIGPGQWTGPLDSAYGVHLVNVQQRTDTRLPTLVEIRDQVKREYIFDRQRDANEQFYNNLRKRYEVIVEQPLEELPGNAQPETRSQKAALQ
jgi:parvulin-like peptidyl-prolyl isomerase